MVVCMCSPRGFLLIYAPRNPSSILDLDDTIKGDTGNGGWHNQHIMVFGRCCKIAIKIRHIACFL